VTDASHNHNHSHSHDHAHVPTVSHANERKVLVSFFLIFTFMLVEAIGGILSGSLALLADAGHMLTDAASLALAYAAFRFGRRPCDDKRTFGYLRFEVIAGFINAVTLFVIAIWIFYEAWERLSAPVEILSGPMMIVAIIGLIINIIVLWIITRGDNDHVNIRGAILHVMGDLLGSLGAIAAAIIISLTGWMPIDPILSVVVALLILRSAWKLLAKSLHILLEGAPDDATPQMLEQRLMKEVSGLARISHIHVWQLTSGHRLATLHIKPQKEEQAKHIVKLVEQVLRDRLNIEHATIAIDWETQTDETMLCSLQQPGAPHAHSH